MRALPWQYRQAHYQSPLPPCGSSPKTSGCRTDVVQVGVGYIQDVDGGAVNVNYVSVSTATFPDRGGVSIRTVLQLVLVTVVNDDDALPQPLDTGTGYDQVTNFVLVTVCTDTGMLEVVLAAGSTW